MGGTELLIASIAGTLGTSYLSGRAQQEQYEAAAAQARANANLQAQEAAIAAQNAQKANKQAEETARVNAQNVEDERRRQLLYINKQNANIGKSGLTRTGSAAALVNQSREEIDYETAKNLSNGQQEVYKLFGMGTDYSNQSNKYKWQEANYRKTASDYEAAGNRAFWGSMLGGLLNVGTSLAGGLYSSKSSGAMGNSNVVGGTVYTGARNNGGLGIAGQIMNTNFLSTSPSRTWNLGKR